MEAREVVASLREHPFNFTHLTLAQLGETQGEELLRLVGQVIAALSPPHAPDLKEEAAESLPERVLSFLSVMKYNHGLEPSTFQQAVLEGHPDVLIPVLRWATSSPASLSKQAFVAHHLSPLDIPPEYLQDPELAQLLQQTQELQRQFVQSHKGVERWRSAVSSLDGLQERVRSLEQERDQLKRRIRDTDDKVKASTSQKQRSELSTLATSLRKEQDRLTELSSQHAKEQEKLHALEEKLERLSVREGHLHSVAAEAESSPHALVRQLEDEVHANRKLANEQLPRKVEQLKERIEIVQSLPTLANSEADVAKLHEELIQLENDSKELERNVKRRKEESESDAQMKKQQQTARNVARKKSELQAKLDKMRERRKKLIGDDGLDATAADVNAKQQPMSEDERKRVVEVADTYKTLKRQMDETNAELLTLTQTEERLKGEEREAAKALEEAKQRAAFSGAAKPEPEVPDVSQKKASAEEEKDSEMDMSAAVKEIHNTIEARKGELQPKMEALRARREQFKELEAEHTEAKREYTSHKSSHESKRAKLERTVTSLRSDTAQKEHKYHELEARSATADAEVQQATCEQSQQSLVEQLQAQVARDEEVLSELEARSGFLDESVGRFSAQKQMLGDLKMLLDARKASAASTESIGETFRVGESDVLAL